MDIKPPTLSGCLWRLAEIIYVEHLKHGRYTENASFLSLFSLGHWIEREMENRRLNLVYFILGNYSLIIPVPILLNIYWLFCLNSWNHLYVLSPVIHTPSLVERSCYFSHLKDREAQRLGYSAKIQHDSPRFESQCVQSLVLLVP